MIPVTAERYLSEVDPHVAGSESRCLPVDNLGLPPETPKSDEPADEVAALLDYLKASEDLESFAVYTSRQAMLSRLALQALHQEFVAPGVGIVDREHYKTPEKIDKWAVDIFYAVNRALMEYHGNVDLQGGVQALEDLTYEGRMAQTPTIDLSIDPELRELYDAVRSRAACRGLGPDIFYPHRGDKESVEVAKSVCAVCPVREDCLDFAVKTGDKKGVWGGTTDNDRRPLRRAYKAQ